MPTKKKCKGCGKELTFTEENKPHGNHLNSSLKCKKYYDDGDKKLTAVTKIEKVEAKKSVGDKVEVKNETSYKTTDGNNNEKACEGGQKITFTKENVPHGNHLNSSLKCKKYYDGGDKKLTVITRIEKVEAKKSIEVEVKKDTSYKTADRNNNEKACEGCGQKITFTKENVPHGNHLGANIQCEKFYLKQKKAQLLQQLIDKIRSLKLLMKKPIFLYLPLFS